MGSARLVSFLKKELGGLRVGHSGTLDRFAEGLMILVTGRATPLADHFLHKDKSYTAFFQAGKSTTTHEPEGGLVEEVDQQKVRHFFSERQMDIEKYISSLPGEQWQTPPDFSALKIGGKRASDRVRNGESVDLRPRRIQIYDSKILEMDKETGVIHVNLSVSSGTYIRSIARDLSHHFSFPFHLSRLIRTRIGEFHLDDPRVWRPEESVPYILSPPEATPHWPCLCAATPDQIDDIRHGRLVPDFPSLENCRDTRTGALSLKEGDDFYLVNESRRALAWCRKSGDLYEYRRVFL